MERKRLAILAVIALISIVAVSFVIVPQFSVFTVQKVALQQRGVGNPGQVLQGGYWRVFATTQGAENVNFLTLNQTVMQQYAGSDYPPDIAVLGSVTFGIYQNQPPFWRIPMYKVEDLTLHPGATASKRIEKDSTYKVESMKVSIWRTDLSAKELVIPFTISILKTQGSKLGSLVTNYPGATKITSSSGDAWQFSISGRQVSDFSQPSIIDFYNPQDSNQRVRISLQFIVGDPSYQWTQDWVAVTPQNGGSLSNNVFDAFNLGAIEDQLNYALGKSFNFANYWFGGGSWLGEGSWLGLAGTHYGPATQPGVPTLQMQTWSDGTKSPLFTVLASGVGFSYQPATFGVDNEGYDYDRTTVDPNAPKFPGWYCPAPGNHEGISNIPDWQLYRLPTAPTVYNNQETLNPVGLSVVNFLQQSYAGGVVKSAVHNVDYLNYWGQGSGSGAVGVGQTNAIAMRMPTAAYSWSYTMDVSTELVDSVVVQQNYPQVSIENFGVDRQYVDAHTSALATLKIKNNSPYGGAVSVGVAIPDALKNTIVINGGDSQLYLTAGETKDIVFQITNTGNLAVQSSAVQFTCSVWGMAPGTSPMTRTFSLVFNAGLTQSTTRLQVITKEQDTNMPINGLTVKVQYGQIGNDFQTLSTTDGSIEFDLGGASGSVTVYITDNTNRYNPYTEYFNINSATLNQKIVYLTLIGGSQGTNPVLQYLVWIVAIIVVVLVVAAAILYKKKKGL